MTLVISVMVGWHSSGSVRACGVLIFTYLVAETRSADRDYLSWISDPTYRMSLKLNGLGSVFFCLDE